MMRGVHQAGLLIAKDMRLEARGRETTGLVVVLGILIIVVLGLGLGAGRPVTGFGATSILWVAYLFGGILCFDRTMANERDDDVLSALLVAPMDRAVLYVAKLATNLVLMIALATVITPVAIVLFRFDLSAAPGSFVAVMLLGMTGFAAVGTLFAAVASSTRLQSGLLAILVFPLSLPVVIVSTQIMRRLFESGEPLSGSGLGILVAFDVIYLVVSWLVFELVLEP